LEHDPLIRQTRDGSLKYGSNHFDTGLKIRLDIAGLRHLESRVDRNTKSAANPLAEHRNDGCAGLPCDPHDSGR
jgi:hypothetical protein